MSKPCWLAVLALLSACGPTGDSSEQAARRPVPVSAPVTQPTLKNRAEAIEYRDQAARMLLAPGDSVTINVFIRIDDQGAVHQPEVKQDVADPKLVAAAISVVQKMQFTPAQQEGKNISVLMKIPVRFVHPARP